MAKYKKIWSAYEQEGDYGSYLSIQNMTNEPITIHPSEKIFLNATKPEVLAQNPKVPKWSKSVKVQDEEPQSEVKVDPDDLPF
jgi:hypothetical protein